MADARPPRMIAGWPVARVLGSVLLLAALVWGAWATRTLIEVERRAIVSVSLARLVEDFVAAEARNSGSPEAASARTAAYLAAINKAVGELAQEGTTVIVSEATLARSVPDRTDEVRRRVSSAVEAGDGGR